MHICNNRCVPPGYVRGGRRRGQLLGRCANAGNHHGDRQPQHRQVGSFGWLAALSSNDALRRALAFPTTLTPRIEANDFLFLRGVAASGGGIAPLPTFIAQPYVASGDLVRVLPSVRVDVGGMVLLYSSTRPLARKVAAFRDFIIEVTQREWVGQGPA